MAKETFACPECGRKLRTMVSHHEKGRKYGIDHCEECLRDFEWEYDRGELKYLRRYFHG